MIKIFSLFHRNYNYGGMLQAFALWRFITLANYHCIHIAFTKDIIRTSWRDHVPSLRINRLSSKWKSIVTFLTIIIISNIVKCRRRRFYEFENVIAHNIYSNHTVSNAVKEDDIFIAGSDQIWNPAWTEDAYFLNFVPDHNGKIAYAASIGTNSVSQTFLEHVVPLINRFDFISVREESAKEILQPYVDKPIKVVLDPTLLLRREEWDEIAVQPTIPEPYIFVYLLGEKREHRRLIKKYAKTLGLKIVFLPHVHFRFNPADCFFADYNLYDVGPREFVGLIKNAETVITDSFHGCVFSIIYQKKFWALKRHKDSEKENMNSRLYTLFDSLGLRDRLIEDESATYDAKSLNRQIDYSMVETKLEALRKDSSDFLLNAIESVRKRMENDKHSAK